MRFTDFVQSTSEDDAVSEWDKYLDEAGGYAQGKRKPSLWVGATYLFTKTCKDPKIAVASIKRDENDAKKKARAQGFRYMDQLFKDQPCMSKPVNVMTYDMQPFLQSCIDRHTSHLPVKTPNPSSRYVSTLHSMRRGLQDPWKGSPSRKVHLLQ